MNRPDPVSALTVSADPVIKAPSYIRHERLLNWVRDFARRTSHSNIVWCDGSEAEYDRLCAAMVGTGTLLRLNAEKRPNSYLARSDPSDVARVEDRTFICSNREEDAGPTNNWVAPVEMRKTLGIAVFSGMLGVTVFGVFLTPVFFVLVDGLHLPPINLRRTALRSISGNFIRS